MAQYQLEDPTVGRLIRYQKLGRRPTPAECLTETKAVNLLLNQWAQIVEQKGVLYRRITGKDKQTSFKL